LASSMISISYGIGLAGNRREEKPDGVYRPFTFFLEPMVAQTDSFLQHIENSRHAKAGGAFSVFCVMQKQAADLLGREWGR